jgi:Na+/H+ antiporter NhaD/arsenite permease-like protein
MLSKYLGFNDFLFNLCPGVIVSSPAVFYFLVYFWKEEFEGQLKADIPKLQKMYPITDPALLVKCGAVLACVISSFFLHPLTHFDPAWVAILGAIWLLVVFDMHHCHEALHGSPTPLFLSPSPSPYLSPSRSPSPSLPPSLTP